MLEQAYEKATGTKVAMTRASSGETFAKIKAESSNPKGDVWFGGTGDPHLTAAVSYTHLTLPTSDLV